MIHIYSDPHFGHRNMAEVFTVKVGETVVKARPFTSNDHMTQTLLERYRAVVSPEDTVWWLGDVCFKPSQELLAAIASLPGFRHLILGNHDRESVGRYQGMRFQKIRSSWQTTGLLFTHIPVHPGRLRTRRGVQMVNVHGHTHTNTLKGPYVNVCVEHTGYAPLSFPEVERRAEARRLLQGVVLPKVEG